MGTTVTEYQVFSEISSRYYDLDAEEISYQQICDDWQRISGAEYVLLNLLSHDKKHLVTAAVSGDSKKLEAISAVLGADLIGKEWKLETFTVEAIQAKTLIKNSNLQNTVSQLPKEKVKGIVSAMDAGDMYYLGLFKRDQVIGTCVLVTRKGEEQKNAELSMLFAKQVADILYKKSEKHPAEDAHFSSGLLSDSEGKLEFAVNKNGEVTFVNQSNPHIHSGGNILDFVSGKNKNLFTKWLNEAFSANKPIQAEISETHGTNIKNEYTIHFIPLKKNSTVHAVHVICTNISKQKELSEEREKTNSLLRQFRQALDSSSIVCKTDTDGTITYVNTNFSKITKYAAQELAGKNISEIKSGMHDENFWKKLWDHISNGLIWKGEVCNKAKDGVLFWVDASILPVFDLNGSIQEYMSIMTDITERKLSEIKLREKDEQVLNIFRSAPDAVVMIDEDEKIVEWNPEAERIFGYTLEEVLGKELSQVIIQEKFRLKGMLLYQGKRKHSTFNKALELNLINKQQIEFPASINISETHIRGKKYSICFISDISERKNKEKLLWRKTESQRIIYNVLQKINGELDVSKIVHKVISSLREFYETRSISISLLSYDKGAWRDYAAPWLNENELGPLTPITKGVVGRAYRTGLTQNVSDTNSDPDYFAGSDIITSGSEMAVPIKIGSETKGVINFQSVEKSAFNREDISFAESIAETISISLEGARLYNIAQREIEERKKAEKLLSDTEADLSHIIASNPAIIYRCKATEELPATFISNNVKAQLGYESFEVLANADFINSRIHPEDRENTVSAGLQFLYQHGFSECEYRIQHKDGHYRWFYDSKVLLHDQHNQPTDIYGSLVDISERKRTEEQIKKSENNFRQITETIKDVFYLYDIINEKYDYISPNCKEILGIEREKLFNREVNYIRDFVYSEDQDYVKKSVANVRKGLSFEIEYRIDVDGKLRWIQEKSVAVLDKEGLCIKNSGVCTDITKRKELEEDLIRNQTELSSFLNDAYDIIQSVDEQGNYTFVNKAWQDTIGYSPEEARELNFMNVVHPDYVQHCQTVFSKLIEKLIPQKIEVVFVAKGGAKILAEGSVNVSINKDGEKVTRGIFRDITRRREAENELKTKQELLEQAQQIVRLGNFESDLKAKKVYWSEEMYRILGVDPGLHEPNFNLFISMFHPEDKEARLKWNVDNIESDEFRFTNRIITGKGEVIYIEEKGIIFRDEDGNRVRVRGTIQDVTGAKTREQLLIEARKKAEEADKAKSEFLANISHEIRTPLNAVLGFAELLKGKSENEEYKHYVNGIIKGGEGLLALINDILDLSKLEAGKVVEEPVVVDIKKVAKELEAVFYPKKEEKGLLFNVHVDKRLPAYALLDEVRLRQILFNLLGNAFKFTEKGEVWLNIISKKENKGQSVFVFEIGDTGIGIPENQRELIFEAFRQQDGQSTRKFGGTGLGLTITRRLVSIMKGKISVQSETGKGSVFVVEIPCIETTPTINNQLLQEEESEYTFNGQQVLLIEDNSMNRAILKDFLEPCGLNIAEAENGLEAFNKIDTVKPDLILLDMMMPVMGGEETLRKLKLSTLYQHIPVIIFSASGPQENDAFVSENSAGWLRKPVLKRDLFETIGRILLHTKKISGDSKNVVVSKKEDAMKPISKTEAKKIKDLFLLEWQEIGNMKSIDDILLFSEKLINYANDNKCEELKHYAQNLHLHASKFEIAKMNVLFSEFETLIKK